jgi:hypothetical protein
MRTSTPYVAPGTCAAPERGKGLQNWASTRERMEVEREIWNVVKSNLKGVVISPNWVYNNTFGVYINELCAIVAETITAEFYNGILHK